MGRQWMARMLQGSDLEHTASKAGLPTCSEGACQFFMLLLTREITSVRCRATFLGLLSRTLKSSLILSFRSMILLTRVAESSCRKQC